jgi:hypothetical protein
MIMLATIFGRVLFAASPHPALPGTIETAAS